MTTNVVTNNEEEYFKWEDEFEEKLDYFAIHELEDENQVRASVSFEPPITSSEHIVDKGGNIGYVTDTNGGVLLGKMSFQMTEEEYSADWFTLTTSEDDSPKTGIKINLDVTNHFEAQSTFRFTAKTESKDADLTDIILSTGEKNEEDPSQDTYKTYELDPIFDKDSLDYETTLMEYIDDMDLTVKKSDEKATMKVKIPKRDEDNQLVYESDGTTIVYEEKDIDDQVPLNIVINKLGEPDTLITVIVTAEDPSETKEYTITIKRPYGTIKGQSILANFDNSAVAQNIEDLYGVTVNHKTTINIYNTGQARWEEISDIFGSIYTDPFTYDDLDSVPIEKTEDSEDDGTYEIYVIPGTYDVQVTRLAYLDYVYTGVVVNDGDEIDMGTFNLPAGDINRDGIISLEDIVKVKQVMGLDNTDPDFSDSYSTTQVGVVLLEDLVYVKQNQGLELQVVSF